MKHLSKMLLAISVALISACGSAPQSLILGKWEADSAVKLAVEFKGDGTARITMFGQTLQGTYKLNDRDELRGR